MRLRGLHEGRAKRSWNPGWEQEVKPSHHYLKKSKDPLRAWEPQDLVMAFVPAAKSRAKYIIKKFNLQEDDLEDLVQTGLLKALEKIQALRSAGRPVSGQQLLTYIQYSLYDWMIQGGGKGEDWRSTTAKDLRAVKAPPEPRGLPVHLRDRGRETLRLSPAQRRPFEITKAAGSLRDLEDARVELLDVENREELAYAVDGITKERTRDIMRRFLGVIGKPPIYSKELAPEFGISPQSIGLQIKKGMLELQSILADL